MQAIESPERERATTKSLQTEIKLLRRQVEKLAEENAELLKKLAAIQTSNRPS